VELQGRLETLKREGLGMVAVSYDPVPVLTEFAARRNITFPLLSDTGSAVIRRYGLLNTTVATTSPQYGIPFPGTFIVNARGVVTSRHFETAYQERDTITSVLVRLGARMDIPGTKLSAPNITLTTYATDSVAAPGTHFSLVVDVVPGPRVHVYAPGVVGYRPIELAVQPQAGLVVRAPQFPKAEDYFFKPLNEHVAVYQTRFRIVQDLAVDPSAPSAAALKDRTEMAIAGTLHYQACDDKVCFTPQAVPLTWTIGLRPLDRERAKQP
jgi:AhpC/TSA family/Thiol:disulfide interchange protein DsbD, N-terminal